MMDWPMLVDSLMLASIAVCILIWPTQFITPVQNRWLRIVTVLLGVVQIAVSGPQPALVPAHLVLVIFIARLLPKQNLADLNEATTSAPSLTLWQWAVIAASALALLTSVALRFAFVRS